MNDSTIQTKSLLGLSSSDVAERIADGRTNRIPDAPVRTTRQILQANVLTPVNGIMSALLVLILIAGFPGDALFAGVIIANSFIGVVQELRARRTLSELAVLSAPKARAIRDSKSIEIELSEIVIDDLLELKPGDQVAVDGEIINTIGLEIDESLLTGEAEPIHKDLGDQVLSGSFVTSGSGHYRTTRIGGDSYAASLAEEARRFKLADSELRAGVNKILRWLVLIIPPASVLLLLRLLNTEEFWEEALRGTVAAAVAMVPDGLVLLTSLSFITGVVALARRKALCKELASVELLARVDVLCLDKTGTITTGEISISGIEPLSDKDPTAAIGAVAAADPSPNATLKAIADFYPNPGWKVANTTPFSSSRKWAATSFIEQGTFHLGAPDIILPVEDFLNRQRVSTHASQGKRILVLTYSRQLDCDPETLPEERTPICLILLEDTVRPDAAEIFNYLKTQGVELKVISGDHPATVTAVAKQAGIPNLGNSVDASSLRDDEDLVSILKKTTVFGRVTPHQKQNMVAALQASGKTVAMTGDGVNDVLALKDSDMGIAMGSGSPASRAVAQLVLLDNRFSSLPRVLAEGRRVINNIERVANLFISKASYAVLLTFLIGLAGSPFPFLPKQLTLIGTFSIGVPGFFLALAPDESTVRPGFLKRVIHYSLPAGIIAAITTFICYEIVRRSEASLSEARTAATITLLAIGLVILLTISHPIQPWKLGLVITMAISYVGVIAIEFSREYFEMALPPKSSWLPILICILIGGLSISFMKYLKFKTQPKKQLQATDE